MPHLRRKKYNLRARLWLLVGMMLTILPIGQNFWTGQSSARAKDEPSKATPVQNGFLNTAASVPTPALTDAEIIRQFSASFLNFDADKCHFTNNQGLNRRGVFHDGYDFNCLPLNTPFQMTIALPLTILQTGPDLLYGNYIIATDQTKRFTFIFGHLSEIYTQVGDTSSTTSPLFKTGRTGNATGVHLHVEILKNGFPTQLDDTVYAKFKTIYKKKESTPEEVLPTVLGLSRQAVQDSYFQYLSNQFYPLNWYKLISLATYENLSLLGLINNMQLYPINDYYQFYSYFVNQKHITDAKERNKILTEIRKTFYALTSQQFQIDLPKEKQIEQAELDFRAKNPIDYPPPKAKKKK